MQRGSPAAQAAGLLAGDGMLTVNAVAEQRAIEVRTGLVAALRGTGRG